LVQAALQADGWGTSLCCAKLGLGIPKSISKVKRGAALSLKGWRFPPEPQKGQEYRKCAGSLPSEKDAQNAHIDGAKSRTRLASPARGDQEKKKIGAWTEA